MKKLSCLHRIGVLGLAFASVFMANGRQLSPEEALQRINVNGPRKAAAMTHLSPKPVMTMRNNGFTSLYVFDGAEKGYVILSADDCAVPMLGYSDNDSFNPDNIPPQLQEWLDFYAREIEYYSRNRAQAQSVAVSRPDREPISPLTKSKWNQDAPYNDDCPLDNGKRSVTGCVATAMAQVMYYHQWPATGQGSESYKWAVGDTTLSLDFSDITFDWADMTDTYGKESTAAQKAAVAQLMYACGVSVHMHYTSGESGAAPLDMGHALRSYFKYSANMSSPQRYFYGLIDWENLVYGQLQQGLPVLYNGQGSIGGHQFICDGYSSGGYFHFNWGWSGMSDGYYLLSALDPMEQGIGGNLTGFDYEQGIWLNVKPASDSDSENITPLIYGYGNFETSSTQPVELGDVVEFEASKDFTSFTNAVLNGRFGIAIVSAEGDTTYVAHDQSIEVNFYSGPHSFKVTLPSGLADGSYTVTPAFKMESTGQWSPILCSLSGVQALKMTVSDGKASFASFEPASVAVTSFKQNTPFYFNTNFSVTVGFSNAGTKEYYGEIMLALVDDNGTRIDNAIMSEALNLPAGQSTTVDIVSDFPRVYNKNDTVAPGDYYLQVYEYMTGNVLYTSSDKVSISQAPKTQIAIENMQVESESVAADGKTDIHFSGTVECTEGYFAGQLQVRVYKKDAVDTSAKAKSDYFFVDPGDENSFDVTVVLPDAKEGEEYYAEVFWNDTQVGDEKYPFTIENETSSIADASETRGLDITICDGNLLVHSSGKINTVRVFSASGLMIGCFVADDSSSLVVPTDSFASGLYIVHASDASGNTCSKKLFFE